MPRKRRIKSLIKLIIRLECLEIVRYTNRQHGILTSAWICCVLMSASNPSVKVLARGIASSLQVLFFVHKDMSAQVSNDFQVGFLSHLQALNYTPCGGVW